MRLLERVVLLALCLGMGVGVAVACSSPASPESAEVSATPAASTPAALVAPAAPAAPTAPTAAAAPAAAAPSSPGAAPPGSPAADEPSEVCPLPRRCDPACAKANWKANDVCMPMAQELMKQLPNVDEVGRCTAACLKASQAKMCVGPANESECACTRKCKALIPAALLEKGKAYDACYRKAIEAACY